MDCMNNAAWLIVLMMNTKNGTKQIQSSSRDDEGDPDNPDQMMRDITNAR